MPCAVTATTPAADTPFLARFPDGPKLPRLLQVLSWIYRPTKFMESCARRFPGAYKSYLPARKSVVFLTEPAWIEALFAMDGATAAAGRAASVLQGILGSNSVLLLDGPRHQRQRKLMMPPFHGDRMRAYAETLNALAEEALARWPLGTPFRLHIHFQELTLESIFRVVLGGGSEGSPLRTALRELLEYSMRPSLLLMLRSDGGVRGQWLQERLGTLAPHPRFLAHVERTNRVVYEELARRRAAGVQGEDILSLLLSARDEDGAPMTDEELRDQLVTLLVAGHETTATSLSWTFAELVKHPEVLAKAREELAREVGDEKVDASHLLRLRYLDAIVTESLRLRPVLPVVARFLEKPVTLGPYHLPPGTVVCPCIYLTHRRPDLYPEPERFMPERWLERAPDPAAYFPFGGGARRCLGRAFALFEMKIMLAHILPRVDLAFAPGYRPRVARRSITFAPSDGVRVVATRRAARA